MAVTVTTAAVVVVDWNNATTGGTAVADEGEEILTCGVCVGASLNPTLDDEYTEDTLADGAFSSALIDLEPGTHYHARAYATYGEGDVAYGADRAFTTPPADPPSVTTNAASMIASTTARLNGTVTSSGGLTLTRRGFCMSQNSPPTMDDTIVPMTGFGDGGGYLADVTDLPAFATWYVRAFAENDAGRGMGDELSFATLSETSSRVRGFPGMLD